MDFHPIANLFPLMEGEDFERLKADIAANGLVDAIVVHEEKILDGRNRWRACRDLKLEWDYIDFDGDDPFTFVVSKNLHRRHLTVSQRAMVAADMANLQRGGDRSKPPIGGMAVETAADLLKVGTKSVERAKTVKDKGIPELGAAVTQGKIPVSAAAEIAKMPTAEQVELFKGDKELRAKLKELKDAKDARAALPSKEDALAKSKETGTFILARDGKEYIYVPPDESERTGDWLKMLPHFLALEEPAITPERLVECVDEFWVEHFPVTIAKVKDYLERIESLLKEKIDGTGSKSSKRTARSVKADQGGHR